MSIKNIGILVVLISTLGFFSGCIEDKVAPPSDIEPSEISLSISPATLTLPTGAAQEFRATLSGSGNRDVIWSVQEGAAGGSIVDVPNEEGNPEDPNNQKIGAYRAPAQAGTFHVVVTSQVDPSKSATATVTVSFALDAGFGTNGKVQTGFGGDDRVNALAIQSDGKIIAAGLSLNGPNVTFALLRYNGDGTLDSSFGTDGLVTTAIGSRSEINALAIQSDGKIVAGGFAAIADNGNDFAIARYNTNGTLDTTFDGDGIVTTAITPGTGPDEINALAIQTDGKIVAGGFSFSGTNDDNDFALARYNTDGSLDTTFSADGKVTTPIAPSTIDRDDGQINGLAIQTDGKIVAGGFAFIGGNNNFALARYTTTGSPDTTFGTNGKVTTVIGTSGSEINALIIQTDDKIVAGGLAAITANGNDFALARYDTNGVLDPAFDTDGVVTTAIAAGAGVDEVNSVAIQADGKIVAGGLAFNNRNRDFALVRYNTNGSLDTAFDGDGKDTTAIGGDDDEIRVIALQGDGKIVAGGFSFNGAKDNIALARYNTDGGLDTSFDADGLTTASLFDPDSKGTTGLEDGDDELNAIAVQGSDDKIIAGGFAFGLNLDFALARYQANGTLDTTFGNKGRVRTTNFDVTGINGGDSKINALIIQSDDGKILAAGSTFPFESSISRSFALARYTTSGALDTAFSSDGKVFSTIGSGNAEINTVALQSDKKIVAAGTSFDGTNNNFTLARYSSAGALDAGFGTGGIVTTTIGTGSSFAKAIAIQPIDQKILVAGVSSSGSRFVFTLVRYNTNGSLDTAFNTTGIVTTPVGEGHDIANAMAVQPDGKIIVGGTPLTGALAGQFALVRYNTDGSLDSSFGNGGVVTTLIGAKGVKDGQLKALAIQSDLKILAGGFVFNPANNRDFAVVRHHPDGTLDSGFGVNGIEISPISVSIDEIHALGIQSNGGIIAGGIALNAGDRDADFQLIRYTP